jgi:CDP-paratose synthetase
MIALTGATGFLGSRLLAELLASGYEVVAIKRSFSNTYRIDGSLGNDKLHLFDIDLCNPSEIFEKYPIRTIVHTATEYGRSSSPIFKILEANLVLPLRLAELGIKNGVECFINTDSFFNKSNNSYSNLLNYSLSKKSLLIWLDQLSSNLKILNVVLEHIYGPNDDDSKFIKSLIQQISINKVSRVPLTHGHQKRDFVYIDDVVSAYIKLIEFSRTHDFLYKSFEVGVGHSVQIRELAEIVKSLSNTNTVLGFGDIPYRRDEIMDSVADISQLRELGWEPKTTLSEGILRTIQLDAENIQAR